MPNRAVDDAWSDRVCDPTDALDLRLGFFGSLMADGGHVGFGGELLVLRLTVGK